MIVNVQVDTETGEVTTTTHGGLSVYTVKAGDNLSLIAQRFGTSVNDLVRLNHIANRDLILPGQRLRLS